MSALMALGLRALPYVGLIVIGLAAICFASFAVWRGAI